MPTSSAPQAEDSDVDAHTEDGTQEQRSSSDHMKAYEKKKDVLHAFRVNEFKYRCTQSNNCDVMCCLSRPTGKGSWLGCAAVAKLRRDAASAGMLFVEVTTPHSNDYAHRTMGLRRSAWLEEAGRDFIEQQAASSHGGIGRPSQCFDGDCPPAPCSNFTPPSQTGMVNTMPVCGDDVLAAMCHALTNGPGSPTANCNMLSHCSVTNGFDHLT